MAVMQVVLGPPREVYESVNAVIDFAHRRPAGLLTHAAGELPSGRMRIVAIWESTDAIDAFYGDVLGPAFKANGFDEIADVEPETVELVDLF
jgi:hypothetical protein